MRIAEIGVHSARYGQAELRHTRLLRALRGAAQRVVCMPCAVDQISVVWARLLTSAAAPCDCFRSYPMYQTGSANRRWRGEKCGVFIRSYEKSELKLVTYD